jgi:hypothetical protein
MEYPALFYNVFEAVNLLLIKFKYEKFGHPAMAFGSSPEHRVLTRVLPWLAIGDFHHIILSTNALCQQLVLTVAWS